MAEVVYALCAVTSIGCAFLLHRGWLRSRQRVLLWAAACFWLLAVNNVLLFTDLVIVRDVDLSTARSATAAAGPIVFLLGLLSGGDR